jgi:hypothetical protein
MNYYILEDVLIEILNNINKYSIPLNSTRLKILDDLLGYKYPESDYTK